MKMRVSNIFEFDFINFERFFFISGPDVWPHLEQFPSCAGEFQSPIDIISEEAIYDEILRPFNFSSLNKLITWNTTNNGHTGSLISICCIFFYFLRLVLFYPLKYKSPDEIEFDNDGVIETISLVQFHFHWGQNDFQGSEHYIDGKKYSGEVRF